ncbi:MAG: Peptidase, M23/M37 family [uncultured Lysobacter sp.]|uniref:Peptidase, M23/M37 family n=1 Tax=uncultured Lysobacter sp. TaxID=271060 RepID=A0A6J4LP16_9GAMM|nr:MAG: Peptidase, M23/M37 family [uncultured Lysobacter sp.]
MADMVNESPWPSATPSPPPPPAGHDYAPAARAVVVAAVLLGALAAVAYWAWHQPFMAYPRYLTELARMPVPTQQPVPVQGVKAGSIADTFGAPRGRDRRHHGIDIFARRGTPVLSATHGVVASIRDQGLGGRQVWVMGPGRERHYYAHLDDWAFGLAAGDPVRPGDELGTVGDTGNARGTPPHLHYGIYGADGPLDPLPRLRAPKAVVANEADDLDATAKAPANR